MLISEPPQIVPFNFGADAVNEGDMAQLTCFVRRGDDPLRITWFLKGAVVSSDPSVTTTMIGTRASMLMISNVGYRHSGTYTCKASNDAGTKDVSATLKVNGISQPVGESRRNSLQWALACIVDLNYKALPPRKRNDHQDLILHL